MNGAFVMCLPPFVDLAIEDRKLDSHIIVEVKHGGNCVHLTETWDKVLWDRIFEV
jgi:hypothetical protein